MVACDALEELCALASTDFFPERFGLSPGAPSVAMNGPSSLLSLCKSALTKTLPVPKRALVERFLESVQRSNGSTEELARLCVRLERVLGRLGHLVTLQESTDRLSRWVMSYRDEVRAMHNRLDMIYESVQTTRGEYAAGIAELRALVASRPSPESSGRFMDDGLLRKSLA